VTGTCRRLLWPGVMTAVMLLVLLGLGSWQVKRLFWKQALLAQIDQAEAAEPVPLARIEAPGTGSGTLSPFMKISVTGTFLRDETALYGAEVRDVSSGPAMGAQLIEPMRDVNGELILVDRGWVPLSRTAPLDQPTGEVSTGKVPGGKVPEGKVPGGMVTVSGYVRPGDTPHWFSAADDPAARRFFTLDPRAIGAAIGHPNIRPFVLVALAAGSGAGAIVERWPDPARHLPQPPNNHLSYAITWYGLAVALLAIFLIWARKGSRA
jgi:surfeit locus 1 family protein